MPEETPKTEGASSGAAEEKAQPKSAETEPALTEKELDMIQPGKASPLDFDFLLIFFIALFADFGLDPFIETVGLPTIVLPILNRAFDVLFTLIIGFWIYWKSKQFVLPEKLAQKVKTAEKKVMAKINAQIQKKVASKAMRKALIRVIPALGIEMMPVFSIFTSWVVAVISMVI